MKKSRFTDEQIIGFLKQAESGIAVKDLCRKHGFEVLPNLVRLLFAPRSRLK